MFQQNRSSAKKEGYWTWRGVPILRKQCSKPSELTNDESPVSGFCKPGEKKLLMRTHKDVEMIDKGSLENDCRNAVYIFHAYIDFKEKSFKMLSGFESMWDVHLGYSVICNRALFD